MRLLILTEIPAPFRIPGFEALAATTDVELHVAVLADRDPRRRYEVDAEGFDFHYRVLEGRQLTARGRWLVLTRGLGRLLRELRPDLIVVGGWNQPAFWHALLVGRRRGIPTVLWVESTARDARIGAAGRLRRAAIGLASAFVVPGRASADYLAGLGVPRAAIAVAPNAVEAHVSTVDSVRPPSEECVFLYVGRLEREKGPDVLVRAFHDVPGRLIVVGDGSLREELERLAPAGRTEFAGYARREELARWYARADAFVLPSRSDTWGMVLNEAAAAGLPLVASDVAGAGYDLIEPGVNGYRVPADDPSALADAMRRVAADPDWRRAAHARSRELAALHTPEAWATAIAALAARLTT
jgi:glycosyltransferase involved in cell wall biosynthesis